MAPLHVCVLSAFATVVLGQGPGYTWSVGGDGAISSTICNETFADANSTGIFTYSPGVPQLTAKFAFAKDIQIGVTVFEAAGESAQWSAWLNTNGANYSNDLALGYDACLFSVQVVTTNTILRGQSDTGDCAATLDSDCNSALTDYATSTLLGLTKNASPSPHSNLSSDSLPRICYDVGESLTQNFPAQCNQFFNGSAKVTGAAMTTNPSQGTSYLGGCTLTNPSNNASFDHVLTLIGESSQRNWVAFNWLTSPFILSWFPVADISATNSISTANSVMACPRAKHVNPGSETVPAAPTPTPLGSGGGLSGGAIAGIVIGVVAGVALVAGAAFWFWRRTKKSKLENTGEPPVYPMDAKQQAPPLVEAPPGTAAVNELSPDNEVRPELPGKGLSFYEKPADAPPAELMADVPEMNQTGR